jgi:hypothetical protein
MLDEDYYGNGVCQWKLTGVGAGGSPSGAPEETAFNGNIDLEHLMAEKPHSMFYWKGDYGTVVRKPDVQIQVSPVAFGSPDRSQFKPALQAELFSLTLTPRKVLP